MTTIYQKIGNELKAYFLKENLSQEEIARTLNVSQQYISSLLNGKPFGKNTARKWSEAFGFNPAWLVTGEGSMFPGKDIAEDPNAAYNSSQNTVLQKLTTIISEKDVQINRLLGIIEQQAETIKLLYKD